MEVLSVQWTSTPEQRRGPWARVFVRDFSGVVLVRTSRASGERRINAVVVWGENAPQVTRDLPMGRIEFFARQLPDLPSEVEAWTEEDGVQVKEVFRDDLIQAVLDEWNRAEGQNALGEVSEVDGDVSRPRLTRPTGANTDAFYRQVADAYTEVMGRTRSVAPVLAAEADVPVRTVHRWIAEARRRGFLPPGRKGRA